MERIDRPAARSLIPKLTPVNSLGYANASEQRKDTMLSAVQGWKTAHPDKVILTRCGDFYESYGVDAVMLVAHANLNPMGGKPKAGCPIQ